MIIRKAPKKLWQPWLLVVIGVVLAGVGVYTALHTAQIKNDLSLQGSRREQFPQVDASTLSPRQAKIVSILRAEFNTHPSGTKYSQGVSEPWCADFVSWVMKEAGSPLVNPNSGSWRIPGTMTLRDYFKQNGNWHPYGDGYVPKTGDVAIYDGNGPNGQHTNFVVRYANGSLVTVGGNEAGAIHVQEHKLDDSLKVIGFGELNNG